MPTHMSPQTHTAMERVRAFLGKIDQLALPPGSRRDVECILVRQAADELDSTLPLARGHGKRTAVIALMLGRLAHLDAEQLHHLKLAALLHDIGLLSLPSHVLLEPFGREPDAYVAMQCHPRLGADLLAPFRFLRKASVIIAHHHERWDGTGYPYGLRGSFIPVSARILSVADAFDAIEVPAADSHEVRDHVAYRIIRVGAGTQFDPQLVHLMEELFEAPHPIHWRRDPEDWP